MHFDKPLVKHDVGEMKARPIQGIERKMEQNLSNSGAKPLKEYSRRMKSLSPDIYASGNRDFVGKSSNILKQIRYEKNKSGRLDTSELDSLLKLKQQLIDGDHQRNSPVKGFIQHISVDPIMLCLWTRSSIKVFHDICVTDTVYWDATGHVVQSKLTNKKLFYYELTVRNPQTNSVSLPVASMVSSTHNQPAIQYWMSLFRNHEKQIYGINNLSQPIQINSDRALTFVITALQVFNGETLLKFLKRSWRIIHGEAMEDDLQLTIVHTCSFHLMRNGREIAKNCYGSKGPRSNAMWMISLLLNASDLKEMDTIFAMIVNITSSKKVDKKLKENVAVMNKKIENFRSTLTQKEMKTVLGDTTTTQVENEFKKEDATSEEQTLMLSPKSPFKKHYFDIWKRLTKSVRDNDSVATSNSLFCQNFASKLLTQLMPTAPLWSGFLLGDLSRHGTAKLYKDYKEFQLRNPKYNYNAASTMKPIDRTTGVSEKRMSVLYHSQLENKKSCRLDDFVNLLYEDLQGMNRVFSDAVLAKNAARKRNKEVITEKWEKSRNLKKEKRSYQKGSGKKATLTVTKLWGKAKNAKAVKRADKEIKNLKAHTEKQKKEVKKPVTGSSKGCSSSKPEKTLLHTENANIEGNVGERNIEGNVGERKDDEGVAKNITIEDNNSCSKPLLREGNTKNDEEKKSILSVKYACATCEVKSERMKMLQCTHCLKWWHPVCVSLSLTLSLKQDNIFCRQCIVEIYREFGNWISFNDKKRSLKSVCQDWNHRFTSPIPSYTAYEKISSSSTDIQYEIRNANRGFENKKSNCWANSILQLLFITALKGCLASTSGVLGHILYQMFVNMELQVGTPMSLVDLEQVTKECGVEMSLRMHQDIDDFLKAVINKLKEDQQVGEQVEKLFVTSLLSINRCLVCGEIQSHMSEEYSVNIPVENLGRKAVSLSSVLWFYLTSEVSKGSMICTNCGDKPLHHCVKLTKFLPDFLFIMLQRNNYDFELKTTTVAATKIEVDVLIDFKHTSLHDLGGSGQMYELIGAITRVGSANVDFGHYVAYVFCKDKVAMIDDAALRYLDKADLLNSSKFQRQVYVFLYRKCSKDSVIGADEERGDEEKFWHLNLKDSNYVKELLSCQKDIEVGCVRLSSLKSLAPTKWLHSEVMDAAFDVIAADSDIVASLSFTVMQSRENWNAVYAQISQRINKDTNIVIVPIHAESHWYAIICYLEERVIVLMDSLYVRKKVFVFEDFCKVLSIICKVKRMELRVDDWMLLQPTATNRQTDGFNCGVYAILNALYLSRGYEDDEAFRHLSEIRQWLVYKIAKYETNVPKHRNLNIVFEDSPTLTIQHSKILQIPARSNSAETVFTGIRSIIKKHANSEAAKEKEDENNLCNENEQNNNSNIIIQSETFSTTDECDSDSPKSMELYIGTYKPLNDFIKNNFEMVRKLVTAENYVLQSERLAMLKYFKSEKEFIFKAKEELAIISQHFPEFGELGNYSVCIEFGPLVYFRKRDEDDIFDAASGTHQWPINIRSLTGRGNMALYVLLPEVLTAFVMESYELDYKYASLKMYGNKMPTTHHEDMLENVSPSFFNNSILLNLYFKC